MGQKLIVEIDLESQAFRVVQPETYVGWAVSHAVRIVRASLRRRDFGEFEFDTVYDSKIIMLDGYLVGSVYIKED